MIPRWKKALAKLCEKISNTKIWILRIIFFSVQNANETHSRIHFAATQYGLWAVRGIHLHVIWWSVINNSNEKNNFSMSSLYSITHFVCLQKEKGIDKVHLWLNKLKSNVNTEWNRNFLLAAFHSARMVWFCLLVHCLMCHMLWSIEIKVFKFIIEVKKSENFQDMQCNEV